MSGGSFFGYVRGLPGSPVRAHSYRTLSRSFDIVSSSVDRRSTVMALAKRGTQYTLSGFGGVWGDRVGSLYMAVYKGYTVSRPAQSTHPPHPPPRPGREFFVPCPVEDRNWAPPQHKRKFVKIKSNYDKWCLIVPEL